MDWNDIINDFNNGMSIVKLSKKYKISYWKIDKYLIENKYKEIRHNKLTVEKQKEVIKLIKEGKCVSDISKELHISKETVYIIANENELNISTWIHPRNKKNKNFRDDYFSVIDTEEKAYFLGLIYTDGNVRIHNGGYFLNIELKSTDDYIIKYLAEELNCGNEIYYRNRITNYGESNMVRFETCNSKQLFDDLAKFNIIPRKTQETTSFSNIEELIPSNLIRHFIRGLLDGDGTIMNIDNPNSRAIIFYQNNKKYCEDVDSLIKKYFDKNIFSNFQTIKNEHVMFCVRYRRISDMKKILTWLYKDSNIYLSRKYELAKDYFNIAA